MGSGVVQPKVTPHFVWYRMVSNSDLKLSSPFSSPFSFDHLILNHSTYSTSLAKFQIITLCTLHAKVTTTLHAYNPRRGQVGGEFSNPFDRTCALNIE